MVTSDERELVADLRGGDPAALATLFDRYGDRLYNHCFRHLGDWAEAEDATSSVFLEVWRHRRRVRLHNGSALPWLYGVATNVCRNAGRSRRRRQRALARLPHPASEADHAEAVTDRLGSEARMRAVLAQVEALPAHEREVLGLVAWAGLTYEQAAAALDVPVGTVRSRLSRARARLAQEVSDD
ncbi:RNA polymerase sigma factor [Nocardioides anomalus]|uniref:RNA polymerase sigma factor n=1 Tax=Nocardioides anomalus TaxID=2712223 RepID=A0A6G6WBR8_9ACTN|nr:RNA polymerase sigma factor [Nocardioides anomalus]QIG42659.1 RNA polymerase sigma factor [Nocardioides anomalus]